MNIFVSLRTKVFNVGKNDTYVSLMRINGNSIIMDLN